MKFSIYLNRCVFVMVTTMPQLHGIINKSSYIRSMFCRNELYHAKSFNLACKLRRPNLACTLTWSGCFLREPLDTVKSQQYSRGLDEAIMRLYGYTFITKTRLYNFDPLQPHFYIVKLGFTGVYIIFLISAQKHRLWVLVRTASARRF